MKLPYTDCLLKGELCYPTKIFTSEEEEDSIKIQRQPESLF